MTECIFCKIVRGEIPGTVVYKDEQVTAFRDIRPVAPHAKVIAFGIDYWSDYRQTRRQILTALAGR